ncbi:S-adenosyl-L-methionine-dependent tRNA 4-demethylwyosine synthase, partial [Dinochytrium kinnereticum]
MRAPRPVINRIDVRHRMDITATATLSSTFESDPILPMEKGETVPVLATSPSGTTFFCLHPASGRTGWVPSWAVQVTTNDPSQTNPFLKAIDSPITPGAQAVTPPITPAHNIQSLTSVPDSVLESIVKKENMSVDEPPSPAGSISSSSTTSSPAAFQKTSPNPSSTSSTPQQPAVKRNPNWDRKYEEKRKAKGTRGHGTNFLKHQQERFSKPYPDSIDALINLLITLQPDQEGFDAVFTEEALAEARDGIVVGGGPGKIWRVWIPVPIWTKFLTCRKRCAPAGTTVAEFAEMLLNLGAREKGGKDKGVEGARKELLVLRQNSVDASLKVDCACATAEESLNKILAAGSKSPASSSKSSQNNASDPSPRFTSDEGTPAASQIDIIAFLNSVEMDVFNQMSNPTYDTSFDAALFDPVAGFPPLDPSWTLLPGGNVFQPPTTFSDISELLQLNAVTQVTPPPALDTLQLLTSPPIVPTMPATPIVPSTAATPLAPVTPMPYNLQSGSVPTLMNTTTLSVNNSPMGLYSTFDAFSPVVPIQYLAPVIEPFTPALDPTLTGFTPLSWAPPTLPGHYGPQASAQQTQGRRFHPYYDSFRDIRGAPMAVVRDPSDAPPLPPKDEHWAEGFGPVDWDSQVKREAPFAPPPETTELWLHFRQKAAKDLAVAKARKLEEMAGARKGGKLERSFSAAEVRKERPADKGLQHAEVKIGSWSETRSRKTASGSFANAFSALKSLLSGESATKKPAESPPPSTPEPTEDDQQPRRRRSGIFSRTNSFRKSFTLTRPTTPSRPPSQASVERPESPSLPPKDEDDAEILEEILRKLKLAPAVVTSSGVETLPGQVVTVLRLFRPYLAVADEGREAGDDVEVGRAVVTAGILRRLVDLGRVPEGVVRVLAKRVTAVGEVNGARAVLLRRLADVGLFSVTLKSGDIEEEGEEEWREEGEEGEKGEDHLRNAKIAVFGLGSSEYDGDHCGAAKALDQNLRELGADGLVGVGVGDDCGDVGKQTLIPLLCEQYAALSAEPSASSCGPCSTSANASEELKVVKSWEEMEVKDKPSSRRGVRR